MGLKMKNFDNHSGCFPAHTHHVHTTNPQHRHPVGLFNAFMCFNVRMTPGKPALLKPPSIKKRIQTGCALAVQSVCDPLCCRTDKWTASTLRTACQHQNRSAHTPALLCFKKIPPGGPICHKKHTQYLNTRPAGLTTNLRTVPNPGGFISSSA